MFKLGKAILVTGALTLAATAQATLIDFTDADQWSKGGTPRTESYGDLDVTLIAWDKYGNQVPFTNTRYDGNKPCADFGGQGLQCETDGVGIGDDEVTFEIEMLQVVFSEAVDIKAITLLDLFYRTGSDPIAEQATIGTDPIGLNYGIWEGTANNDRTGFFKATVDNAITTQGSALFNDVTSLYFGAHSHLGNPRYSDFALAAIELVDVPEPSTIALFGLGLVSLFGARRQQKRQAQS